MEITIMIADLGIDKRNAIPDRWETSISHDSKSHSTRLCFL